ncbi:hypothetical protein [Azorhizobium doebereinerae]|uniref:hypothetical protein n=1 Tax=Azorhizobium doebereinerae TaxID=281091 RepID=UPI000426985B|nr:hypothetical protein [Azorhizobium doebereinerae]
MSGAEPEHRTANPDDFAAYVAAMAGELAGLARGHGFSTLAYLLEMVRLEARGAIRKSVNRRSSALPPDHAAQGLSGVAPERR